MEEEIVIESITLLRCYHCRYLITVGELEEHKGCLKCGSTKVVYAKLPISDEENARLEQMYREGKLQLHFTEVKPNG